MSTGIIEAMMHWQTRMRTRLFTLLLASQFKKFGSGSRIVPPFTFWGLNQMWVGERVTIQRDCWIHVIGGCVDNNPVKLTIQSDASIGKRTAISAAQQVVIEEYVMIGSGCLISDHSHAFNDIDKPVQQQGIDNVKPVFIGRESFVGNNAFVNPGVTIGRHCVIGANSVVATSIPDFSVAIGNPARVVKTLKPVPNGADKLQAQAEFGAGAPGGPALLTARK
jgi:acetyltransferase-like isoleucine patch superfamily enzyme